MVHIAWQNSTNVALSSYSGRVRYPLAQRRNLPNPKASLNRMKRRSFASRALASIVEPKTANASITIAGIMLVTDTSGVAQGVMNKQNGTETGDINM